MKLNKIFSGETLEAIEAEIDLLNTVYGNDIGNSIKKTIESCMESTYQKALLDCITKIQELSDDASNG